MTRTRRVLSGPVQRVADAPPGCATLQPSAKAAGPSLTLRDCHRGSLTALIPVEFMSIIRRADREVSTFPDAETVTLNDVQNVALW
jgi:hypothetical protein